MSALELELRPRDIDTKKLAETVCLSPTPNSTENLEVAVAVISPHIHHVLSRAEEQTPAVVVLNEEQSINLGIASAAYYEPYEVDASRHADIDSKTVRLASDQRLSYNAISAFWRGLSINYHIFWFIAMLLNYILVILLVIYAIELQNCRQSTNVDDDYTVSCSPVHVYAVSLPLVVIYTSHVCMSLNSSFFRMLHHSEGGSMKVGDYVSNMCKGAPLVMHTAHCYHYEDRPARHVSRENQNRGASHALNHDRLQVTKHIDRCQFHYLAFSDHTNIPNIYSHQLVIVEGSIQWEIVNEEVFNRFQHEKSIFFQAHAHCDTHHDYNTYATVKGFEPSMLCCVDPDDVPFAIRHGAWTFRIMTILACGWFYRVWLAGVSGKVQVTFVKSIVY